MAPPAKRSRVAALMGVVVLAALLPPLVSSQASSSGSASSASSSAPRRFSIVNPDFECGGAASAPRRARARRFAQGAIDSELQDKDDSPAFPKQDVGGGSAVHTSCGASVISRRFLLTAASCIDVNNPVSGVRLGDLDLATDGEKNSEPANYGIINIIFHPGYNPSTRYNDIALLMTDREIEFNAAVFPYCVSPRIPAPATTVIAAGYGLYNETYQSPHVLEGELDVIPLAQCEAEYLQRDEKLLKKAYPKLLPRRGLLCAGRESGGVCKGDEGGPLYREDESGRRFLEGITSLTGSVCAEGMLPGLFTAVADYVPFIDHILNSDIGA